MSSETPPPLAFDGVAVASCLADQRGTVREGELAVVLGSLRLPLAKEDVPVYRDDVADTRLLSRFRGEGNAVALCVRGTGAGMLRLHSRPSSTGRATAIHYAHTIGPAEVRGICGVSPVTL